MKVIRNPGGPIHSWKEEEQLHRLLCPLYGAPSLSSTLSQTERSGRREETEATSDTLQRRSESRKYSRREKKGQEIHEGREMKQGKEGLS